MSALKSVLIASIISSLGTLAYANDPLPIDDVEQLPNRKLEKRGERISGPITSIGAAGLLIASFDTNMDYIVNQLEFTAGSTQAFNGADKDNNGMMSLFELEDWRKAALGSLDAPPGNLSFDKDYDQRITRDEFDYALDYVFKSSDKNKDGEIEFSELARVFEMPRRRPIEDTSERIDRLDRIEQGQRQRRR